jgi:outer membrane protein OmpA-like peptidoglycan-associated protein
MRTAALSLVVLGFAACVHQKPQELIDTERAYRAAEAGSAGVYATPDLAAAQTHLNQANRVLQEYGDGTRARDHAYVAQRRIDIANAKGRMEMEKRHLEALNQQAEVVTKPRRAGPAPPPPPPPPEAEPEPELPQAAVPVPVPAEPPPDIPELAAVGDVRQDDRGTVVMLPASLVFSPGAAGLTDTGRERLEQVAKVLKKSGERISIEVHTDNIGAPEQNARLSSDRAHWVRKWLVEKGVPAGRIESHGYGETKPLVDNATPQGRAANRRVEIVIQPKPVS